VAFSKIVPPSHECSLRGEGVEQPNIGDTLHLITTINYY